jgi:peptidoglycan hydrolase-like protein with peptidoglycan-binding domain
MKYLYLFITILTVTVGSAQDYKGYTSFVDLIYTETYSRPLELFTECTAAAPDATTVLECVHNLEIIDGDTFAECEADELGTCGKRYGYPTPFYPEAYGKMVEDAYDKIYERYYTNVYTYAVQELFPCALGGCFLDGGACVANAVKNIVRHAYGSLNTVYWEEIFIASLYYLNTTLWYQLPFPGFGSIVLPIFTDETNPDQYLDYAESINQADPQARGYPYSRTSPAFPNQTVPFENSETRRGFPGLYDFEFLKGDLTVGTLLEEQQYGFSTVLEFYGDTELMIVEPLPCLFALPLPGIRRAFVRRDSIGEGYQIPYTSNTPWVPSADPTGILATDLTALLLLNPEPPPVTSPTPIKEVLACKPMTLADLALIDVLEFGELSESSTISSGGNGPLADATQYLLRDKLLARYGKGFPETAKSLGFKLKEIEITGSFGKETQDALTYFQGTNNSEITGSLDLATLSGLASTTCEGAEGDTVLALQSALSAAGFKVGLTGIFDAATKGAVEASQEQNGRPATGIADLRTWINLFLKK